MYSSGVQTLCVHCVKKKKNPEKHLYTERTIEMGVLVDHYLWQNMKVWLSNFKFHDVNYKPKYICICGSRNLQRFLYILYCAVVYSIRPEGLCIFPVICIIVCHQMPEFQQKIKSANPAQLS